MKIDVAELMFDGRKPCECADGASADKVRKSVLTITPMNDLSTRVDLFISAF